MTHRPVNGIQITNRLDIERHDDLRAYLRRTSRIAAGEHPSLRTLTGGVSNRTVLVERPTGEAWVIKQALRKLRVETDWYSDPRRIEREALGLRWLMQLAPPDAVAPLVFEDHEQHLLAMRAVPRPHDNWKELLLAGQLHRHHVEQFGHLLGTIHRRASERSDEVAPIFADRSFFESLRVEPYYNYTATQIPDAADFLTALVDDTRRFRVTLVHGDYSPKNVLVHHGRLVLLDHEVIHFGDPAFDLGFSLTHLLSKAHHLPFLRMGFAEAAVLHWEAYKRATSGLDWTRGLEERAVRHTLGCLLARVAGRSPLEYLSDAERSRQRSAALSLLADTPATVPNLINEFIRRVESDVCH